MSVDRWHLAALATFAVAQPILTILRASPALFTTPGTSPKTLAVVVAGGSLLLAAAAVAFDHLALTSRQPADRARLRAPVVGVLVALGVLPVVNRMPGGFLLPLLVSAAACVGATMLYRSTAGFRHFLTALIPSVLLCPAIFMFTNPVWAILRTPVVHAAPLTTDTPAPVILIVFDEMTGASLMDGEGRIADERFPHFAALGRTSTWFRNAASVSDETIYAVPAILTGRYPVKPRTPTLSNYRDNLFTWLQDGFDLAVMESWTDLCPPKICAPREEGTWAVMHDVGVLYGHQILPDPLRAAILPTLERRWTQTKSGAISDPGLTRDRSVEDQRDQIERFLTRCHPVRTETLCYLHVTLPHVPWQFLPSGQQYGPLDDSWLPDGLVDNRWVSENSFVERGWRRYLLQTGFADRLLGRVIERLQALDWFDRALVMVTADHGVSFRRGEGLRYGTSNNVNDLASVPLFIKQPGQREGRTSDAAVQTIDVVPTIAETLGAVLPWQPDGRSALTSAASRPRMFHAVSGPIELPAELVSRDVLDRQERLFDGQPGWEGIFRFGPHPELVGRPVASMPQQPTVMFAALESPGLYDRVDPEGDFVPARVKGELRNTQDGRGIDVAIAINDRIRATTTTYVDDGQQRFSTMLPVSAFKTGRNAVSVFQVVDNGAALAPLLAETPPGTLSWLKTEHGDDLQQADGSLIPLQRDGFEGNLERAEIVYSGINVSGWAADPSREPPTEVVVFVGRQYVDRGPVNKRRPDLVTALGMKAPATAGFQRRFPIPRGSSPSLDELRVVAVWGQRYAFELPRRPWYLVSEGNRHSPDYLLTFDRELLIRRNPREGAVLEVRVSSRDVRMSGWTAAPTYGRPVRLVVLNRGRLLWEGSPQFAASDWTADDDGLVRTGFAMSFSLPHLPVAPEFRVFAIWPNETATELPVGDSSPADVRAADGSARAQ